MPGNYAKPFRPAASGSVVFTHPNHYSGCDKVPHWINATKVKPAFGGGDSCPGTPGYTAVPFSKGDPTYAGPCPSQGTAGAGSCGAWLTNAQGDFSGGYPRQDVCDTVSDIGTCHAADSTHAISDLNCYQKSGSINLGACHKWGGKWVTAIKKWQGQFGFVDQCDPLLTTGATCTTGDVTTVGGIWTFTHAYNATAPQTKYRTLAGTFTCHATETGVATEDSSRTSTSTVDRNSGIITTSGSTTTNFSFFYDLAISNTINGAPYTARPYDPLTDPTGFVSGVMAMTQNTAWAHFGQFWTITKLRVGESLAGYTVTGGSGTYHLKNPDGNIIETLILSTGSWDRYLFDSTGAVTVCHQTLTLSNTSVSYSCDGYTDSGPSSIYYTDAGNLTLSNAYSAADLYSDWRSAMQQWDLSDDRSYPWRTDEQLANCPAILYDEVGPQVPALNFKATAVGGDATTGMDDYSGTISGGIWPRRDWLDPYNYIWKYPNGSVMAAPGGFTGGATLISPMRTGAIMSHNPSGYARHFWFGANVKSRDVYPPGSATYIWDTAAWGSFSDSHLPETSLRWQDAADAQYDGELYLFGGTAGPPPGNLYQSWLRQLGDRLLGGKFVQARENWYSLNFARPYGGDRWAIDQQKIWRIVSGTGAGNNLKLWACSSTSGPPVANDYIMVAGEGVFKVTTVSDDGTQTYGPTGQTYHEYKITACTKVANLPTGTDFVANVLVLGTDLGGINYCGKLRFWSGSITSPPPFGLMKVAGTWNGSRTTFTIPPTPWWSSLSSAAVTQSVDLYTADSGNGNPSSAALASGLTLTKFSRWSSSTVFTAGTVIVDSNGNYETCTVGGTSGGGAEPTWPTSAGTTADGGVTWTWSATMPASLSAWVSGNYATAVYIVPAGMKPEYDDNRPKGDFVTMQWTFNNRAAQADFATYHPGSVPSWYGTSFGSPQAGVLTLTISDANLKFTPCCPSVVGYVPFYSGSALEKSFADSLLYSFPSSFSADNLFGAYWMGACETIMVDPYWQTPFTPFLSDSNFNNGDALTWSEDDGTGQADFNTTVTRDDSSTYEVWTKFYPARPYVEARKTYPSNLGWGGGDTAPSLPSGLTLEYDSSVNLVLPSFWANGIPCVYGSGGGGFSNVGCPSGIQPWVLSKNACTSIAAATRPAFETIYENFVIC